MVEATSGNTGIALAMVCAAKGYPFVAIMTETFSVERRKIMRMLGAKVILTPAAERGTGMVRKAAELAAEARLVPRPAVRERGESRLPPQHHGSRRSSRTSSAGGSTTSSPAGARAARSPAPAQMIRLARPEVKIIATEPAGASLLAGKPWAPHKIQGWTPDFVPAVLERRSRTASCR